MHRTLPKLLRYIWKRMNYRSTITMVVAGFIIAGGTLFYSTLSPKSYTQAQLVWDLQWMNAWTLVFCFISILVWRTPGPEHHRRWLLLSSFSVWAVVTYSLLLNGTPFSWGAYWGDQKFRQAMMLKFMTFAFPGDFYYRDLPSFYPPLYYYGLAWIGKICSIDYFELLKTGTQLIYLLAPFVLYFLWSTIVSRFQALLVAITTVVICGICYNLPVAVPHEFVANALFVPWWLAYIEGVGRPSRTRLWYVAGGLIGAAVFCTYYYAFFVGGLILLARMLLWPSNLRWGTNKSFRWSGAIVVLALAAAFSSPYWLPLIVSMAQHGSAPYQREYFHIGHAGLEFSFTKVSWAGLLFLVGLLYSVRHRRAPVHLALTTLIAGIIGYFVLGYVLGNIGEPILYVRSNELLMVIGGAVIGLVVAAALRLQRMYGTGRGAVGIMLLVAFVTFSHIYTNSIGTKQVKTAREAELKDWNTDPTIMQEAAGKVFLTEHELLPSFYPVYVFNAINQQYAHHASQYERRYTLMYELQYLKDPTLFYLALRYNKYDAVDYFMPGKSGSNLQLNAVLSNYPDLFYHKLLGYDPSVVSDSRFFTPLPGDELFKVSEDVPIEGSYEWPGHLRSARDSLLLLYRLRLVASHLSKEGTSIWDEHLAWSSDNWNQLADPKGSQSFGDDMNSLGQSYIVEGPDSLYVLMAFLSNKDWGPDTRPFLHAYPAAAQSITIFDNFPFRCQPPMGQWKKGDVIICSWNLPLSSSYDWLLQGFTTDTGRIGTGGSYELSNSGNR